MPEGFIGRETEVARIREMLCSGRQTLALVNAEGGMGKTTLAAYYWERYRHEYRHLAWLYCDGGIIAALRAALPNALGITEAMQLHADDTDQQIALLKAAMANLPPDCLLVLDNANDAEHIRGFLHYMQGLGWHVLLTSRCARVMPDPASEYRIDHLPPPQARMLFRRNYEEDSPAFEALLDRFLQAVGYNTLCIEVYSKSLREGAAWGLDFAGLIDKLEQNGLLLGKDSFEVFTSYAYNVRRADARTSDQLIETLYDIAGLDQRHPELRDLLLQMALLPPENHRSDILRHLLSADSPQDLKRSLDQLVRLGWLGSDGTSYRLSPVVQKIMLERYADRKWEVGEMLVEKLEEIFAIKGYLYLKNLTDAIPFSNLAIEITTNSIRQTKKSPICMTCFKNITPQQEISHMIFFVHKNNIDFYLTKY